MATSCNLKCFVTIVAEDSERTRESNNDLLTQIILNQECKLTNVTTDELFILSSLSKPYNEVKSIFGRCMLSRLLPKNAFELQRNLLCVLLTGQ
jgi:hypothetical protein